LKGALLAAVAAAVVAAACSSPAPAPAAAVFPNGTVVDLSHTYDETTIFWPTADPFRLEKVSDGMTPQGYYYAANNFFTSEHGGTHLDAPVHFSRSGQSVHEIPVDRFLGAAVVVDVTAKWRATATIR
jgi:kynurenine formamidase